jgi:hypothetical protein
VETERAVLAARFAGGRFTVDLEELPSLHDVLAVWARDAGIVDFSASEWLSGFREAVVEETAGEPG